MRTLLLSMLCSVVLPTLAATVHDITPGLSITQGMQFSAMTTEFLNDRWYFSNVFPTNNGVFEIGFEGTGTRTIDWGDGTAETVTNGSVVVSHTYATAASNVFTIRGSMTRIYFYNLTGSSLLTRILTPANGVTDLTSLYYAFRDCTGLTGSIPAIPSSVTSLYSAFYGCTGLTGSIPTIPSGVTTISSAFYGCTGLTGSIPAIPSGVTTLYYAFRDCTGLTGSIPAIPSGVTTLYSAFYGCTGLTNNTATVAEIFGEASRTNLTTAANAFRTTVGSPTLVGYATDFIKLEKSPSFTTNIYSTNSSYRMFYNQTNLSDYATIDAAWK